MIEIKNSYVDLFYILIFIHNIYIFNKFSNEFYTTYHYQVDDIIIDKKHYNIFNKLMTIFISEFQYSSVSLAMLYIKYIKTKKNIFISLSNLYRLLKKISHLVIGTIFAEVFLNLRHNPIRDELKSLYFYIGMIILFVYIISYNTERSFPIHSTYLYIGVPVILRCIYEKNGNIFCLLFILCFVLLFLCIIENKLIIYITILGEEIHKISNELNKVELDNIYIINQNWFKYIKNKISALNILYICFDIIKQYCIYNILYHYLFKD